MTIATTAEPLIDPAVRAYVDERLAELRARQPDDRVTLVVFSGDLDRNLAALVIATGAAAMGLEVSIFYTFWGLSALKKRPALRGKGLKEKLFALMTPRRLNRMPVSKMNFGGVGRVMLQSMMRDKQVASVDELFDMARQLGVKLIACTMSMDVMGIAREELIDGVEVGGVATFLGDAAPFPGGALRLRRRDFRAREGLASGPLLALRVGLRSSGRRLGASSRIRYIRLAGGRRRRDASARPGSRPARRPPTPGRCRP
jgi:peroxiredoxin family protein